MYIESYKKLIVWQKSMELSKEIYKATENLPKHELYGFVSQMRRCVISIPSNIAEGYKRSSLGEYLQFLGIAEASAAELETQLLLAKDLYSKIDFSKCEKLLLEIQKMLVIMIKKLKVKKFLNAKRLTLNAKDDGFTIVELLVAMTLFVVLISIASGTFIQSMRAQRATTALIAANSNAQLALEQMAREMRTGQNFSSSGSEINFMNANGENVIYRLNAAAEAIERSIDAANFKKLTAGNVKVKNLNFTLFQGTAADPYPPRITISLRIGASGTQIEGAFIDLQTTISSRVF